MARRRSLASCVLAVLPRLLVACRTPHAVFQTENSMLIPCSRAVAYFPVVQENTSGLFWGKDQANWESHTLQRMQEPSLYSCDEPVGEARLRFLWDRSLSAPIAARLTMYRNGRGTLTVSMLAHNGLMPPPASNEKAVTEASFYQRTLAREVPLTAEQVNHALDLLTHIRFITNRNVPSTTDGSDWIFETEEAGRYRLVDFRNEPAPMAKELGLYLVRDLGHVSLADSAVY